MIVNNEKRSGHLRPLKGLEANGVCPIVDMWGVDESSSSSTSFITVVQTRSCCRRLSRADNTSCLDNKWVGEKSEDFSRPIIVNGRKREGFNRFPLVVPDGAPLQSSINMCVGGSYSSPSNIFSVNGVKRPSVNLGKMANQHFVNMWIGRKLAFFFQSFIWRAIV